MSIDKNKYLNDVLQTHKLHHVQEFLDKVQAKREEVKKLKSEHYGNNKYIVNPHVPSFRHQIQPLIKFAISDTFRLFFVCLNFVLGNLHNDIFLCL